MNKPTKQLEDLLNNNLKAHISSALYSNFFEAPYIYSLFPAGKLFRPKIVWATGLDFQNNFSPDLELLASFSEIHHTYTLIHDDMPCMDNDDFRRGRHSTHKQFGQWQALLSGDGLLNASYSLLAKLKTPNLALVLRYTTWALGPKGLILGQALDLSGMMNESFEDLILTHKLKTARLIQCCLVTPILAQNKALTLDDLKLAKELHRLGEHMGVAFQLLDDLCELTAQNLSIHESHINPWPKNYQLCNDQINKSFNYISTFFKNREAKNLAEVFSNYLTKTKNEITANQKNIEKHIGADLAPIMIQFNVLSSL